MIIKGCFNVITRRQTMYENHDIHNISCHINKTSCWKFWTQFVYLGFILLRQKLLWSSAFIDTPGGRITFASKYTCVSENVVYAIKCHACRKICIGETGRHLGDRFREHLRSIRLPDSDLPVGRHFASPGHTTQDMLVSVIRSGFRAVPQTDVGLRPVWFSDTTLHPGGLNVDFAFII